MNKKDIEQEVDKTLAQLGAVRPAKAGAFFFTRLKARMQAEESSRAGMARTLRLRLAVAAAGVAVLVIINVVTLLHLASQREVVTRDNGLTTFAEQYNFTSDQF